MKPLNDKPCGTCDHFDVVLRAEKETAWGWCAKKSLYPHKEGPGQIFPAGVQRVKKGERAHPVMVQKDEVVESCPYYEPRKNKPSKADLLRGINNKNRKVVLS